jgi:two-component system, cell cycle sensor histidine kinase and response regulator CckA
MIILDLNRLLRKRFFQPLVEHMNDVPPAVLVAEDYEPLRFALVRHLRSQGYQVIEGVDGYDALQKARDHSGSIDVLVTDLKMPNLRGNALAHALTKDRPGLRVLFVTSEPAEILTDGLGASAAYLRKPYDLNDVTSAIRKLLNPIAGATDT